MCLRKFFHQGINKKEIVKWGVMAALAESIYCLLVVFLIPLFDKVMPKAVTFLGFFFGLLFLVFSVAISGVLVFGYPAYLALNKRYREALATLGITLLTFIVIILVILLLAVIFI